MPVDKSKAKKARVFCQKLMLFCKDRNGLDFVHNEYNNLTTLFDSNIILVIYNNLRLSYFKIGALIISLCVPPVAWSVILFPFFLKLILIHSNISYNGT
jgi:hypothetical protein